MNFSRLSFSFRVPGRWGVALALLVALSACSQPALELARQPDEARWLYADSLVGSFTVADSTVPHRVVMQLSLTEDYPFRNLYLRLRLQPPTGPAQVATPEFVLQDAFGNWNVPHSLLRRYELSATLNDSARFRPAGRWTVSVRQYTRLDTLPGVAAVRLTVQPVQ